MHRAGWIPLHAEGFPFVNASAGCAGGAAFHDCLVGLDGQGRESERWERRTRTAHLNY